MSIRAIVVAGALLGVVSILSPAVAEPIHASVNIDVMPDHLAEGMAALTDYLKEAKNDPTLEGIQLSQRVDAPNHFLLDLKMADKAHYETHIQAAYVRKFREKLFPCLGSPWDERLYHDIRE
jgi:quinol monooxygenase YgiN